MTAKTPARLSPSGEALTELMLETFRCNGRLIAAGDRLVAPVGLTSARWQVLGAVALAGHPLPVAHIARNMGLTRQSVQRTADSLHAEKLIDYRGNPHHRRAQLVELTARGRKAYDAAMARHAVWANGLATGMKPRDIATALRALRALRERIEQADDPAPARKEKSS